MHCFLSRPMFFICPCTVFCRSNFENLQPECSWRNSNESVQHDDGGWSWGTKPTLHHTDMVTDWSLGYWVKNQTWLWRHMNVMSCDGPHCLSWSWGETKCLGVSLCVYVWLCFCVWQWKTVSICLSLEEQVDAEPSWISRVEFWRRRIRKICKHSDSRIFWGLQCNRRKAQSYDS